jgi:AraC-like DNA-binding protein
MNYQEHKPAKFLSKYIDSYWVLQSDDEIEAQIQRIIPDCCNDVVINIGSDVTVKNVTSLQNSKSYFVGNMTTFYDTTVNTDSVLIGIRFKPLGVSTLLGFTLDGTANTISELSLTDFDFKNLLTSKMKLPYIFDNFFAKKSIKPNINLFEIVDFIIAVNGNIKIADLAYKYCTSERQLERTFKSNVGITIQELCKQVRLKNVISLLKKDTKNRSIMDIAFESGYYDHSHLTKDLIKYTGNPPSYYKL